MIVLVMILTLVGYVALNLILNRLTCRSIVEGQKIETIWTVIPAVILLFLAFPSLRLLYLLDEENNCQLTMKTLGHQWYWSYEYSDFPTIEFDSYMLPTNDLSLGSYRLLEVDNRAVLPVKRDIRVLVSSADVIHSWTVPILGVKADAVPGRLNQLNFYIKFPGIYYGQCSEICGANHSFMPIVVEALPLSNFVDWLSNFKCS